MGDRDLDAAQRRQVVRDALGVGLATGAYGVSFGAVAAAEGFSVLQAAALSILMFTGASQFALVGLAASPGAGAATAVLLGVRNMFYGLHLSSLIGVRGWRRFAASQLVLDEATAMAIAQPTNASARLAFWVTGISIFVCWNVATVIGAAGAEALSNPSVLGLDAAAPAAFLALLAPRVREREPQVVAAIAASAAVALTPMAPRGVPVLAAAAVALLVGLGRRNDT